MKRANHWVFALCAFVMASHPVAASVSDGIPAPVPRYLIGLWAKGHKCTIRDKQLRITARTMQFGTDSSVGFEYYSPDGLLDDAALVLQSNRHAWDYFRYDDIIFEYGLSPTEDDIYYRCPSRGTGRK